MSKMSTTAIGDTHILEDIRRRQAEVRREMWAYDREAQTGPARYSLTTITLNDGTTQDFMTKAAPTVMNHLVETMNKRGFLVLWNDTDTLCIPVGHIKWFQMREITKP